jgi:hypothetical protein
MHNIGIKDKPFPEEERLNIERTSIFIKAVWPTSLAPTNIVGAPVIIVGRGVDKTSIKNA